MAVRLGARADRLANVRALRTTKGRRTQRRFAFEGATLLDEAVRSGFPIDELYVTEEAYAAMPTVRRLEAGGTPAFLVDRPGAARISDLETPTGILAVSPIRLCGLDGPIAGPLCLVLADVNDPANAGSLLRSADAFGAAGVVFGALGVDPFHPKVVRGSMGAIFRMPLAEGEPGEVASAAAGAGATLVGLTASGAAIETEPWTRPTVLVIGNERRGLGRWEAICGRLAAIPMRGASDSLSAAVAGGIALYEAGRKLLEEA